MRYINSWLTLTSTLRYGARRGNARHRTSTHSHRKRCSMRWHGATRHHTARHRVRCEWTLRHLKSATRHPRIYKSSKVKVTQLWKGCWSYTVARLYTWSMWGCTSIRLRTLLVSAALNCVYCRHLCVFVVCVLAAQTPLVRFIVGLSRFSWAVQSGQGASPPLVRRLLHSHCPANEIFFWM